MTYTTQHNPELWVQDGHRVWSRDKLVACTYSDHSEQCDYETARENASRLTACVNACTGIPTEDLVAVTQTGNGLIAALAALSVFAEDALQGMQQRFSDASQNPQEARSETLAPEAGVYAPIPKYGLSGPELDSR